GAFARQAFRFARGDRGSPGGGDAVWLLGFHMSGPSPDPRSPIRQPPSAVGERPACQSGTAVHTRPGSPSPAVPNMAQGHLVGPYHRRLCYVPIPVAEERDGEMTARG